MTENEAKLKYESLNKEARELHLQAARKENERDLALKEWQNLCDHTFGESYSIYGYGLRKECTKCKFEIVN